MSGSNDLAMRKVIFSWIKDHEQTFFQPRRPIHPIGVYFSDKTRNYFAKDFIDSYRGILLLLLQSHLEFQIVTPRSLPDFHGEALILPDVRCLGNEELSRMEAYRKSGKTLLVTGASGKYDDSGAERVVNPLLKMLGVQNSTEKATGKNFLYRPECPGKVYYAKLQQEFDQAAAAGTFESSAYNQLRKAFVADLLKVWQPAVEVTASPYVSTQIADVNGKVSVFLANFKGLRSKEVAQQIPEKNVKLTFAAKRAGVIMFLPFLGAPQKLPGTFDHGKLSVELPPIEKGAVAWVN
jgi:hypothetical protein